jgi:hypothetical protein
MELKPINLGNGILLFKNVLKNPKKTYQFILDSKTGDDPYVNKDTWKTWLPWGNYSKLYPNEDKSYKNSDSDGAELQKECLDIFFNILKIYKEQFLDQSYFDKYGWDSDLPTTLEELESRIAVGNNNHSMSDMPIFETSLNADSDYQMKIHQDVMHWWGGGSHIFNFNIYVNDDYDGGEIIFFKHQGVEKIKYIDTYSNKEKEAWLVEDYFKYKMKAGDGIIFPTDYYHGVLPLSGDKSKFYIRQFISAPMPKEFYEKINNMSKENFDLLFKEDQKENSLKRIMPVLFDSVDSIDLDSPKYSEVKEEKIACVIKTRKNIN